MIKSLKNIFFFNFIIIPVYSFLKLYFQTDIPQLDNINEINTLNELKNIKVIFYHHSSSFDWIYGNYSIFKSIYKAFSKSKYFISIVPFENQYPKYLNITIQI